MSCGKKHNSPMDDKEWYKSHPSRRAENQKHSPRQGKEEEKIPEFENPASLGRKGKFRLGDFETPDNAAATGAAAGVNIGIELGKEDK